MAYNLYAATAKHLIDKIDSIKRVVFCMTSVPEEKKKAKSYLYGKIKEIEEGKDYAFLKNYVKHCNRVVALFDKTVKGFKKINEKLDELKALANML